MQKVLILATKDSESRLISALHRSGVMEIRSLELAGLEKGKPLEVHDAISHELVRVRGLISAFASLPFVKRESVEAKVGEPDYVKTLSEARKIAIDDELRHLVDRRAALISEAAETDKKKAEITAISAMPGIDFSKLETKNFTYALGSVKRKTAPAFRKDLDEYLNKESEIITAPYGKDDELILIFYERKENISFVLSRYNFEKISLPEGFSTFEKGVASLEASAAELKKSVSETEKRISSLSSENYGKLAALERGLSTLSMRAAIATKFASGRKIVAVEGWVKKKDSEPLSAMLKKDFAGEAAIEEMHGDEHGAPVVLDNPKSALQFQWLVEFYSLPSYDEFDPTIILMFTVPLMYGMIVGDVGYGLLSIALSLLILQKFKGGMLGNIAKIWLFSSVSAMVFGVVFDEWFGFSHLELAEWLKSWGLNIGIEHSLYTGLSRSHELSLVIGLALLVGVLHLSLGYILGAINVWEHSKKHAVAKLAWLALLLGGTVAVASLMFNLVPASIGNPAAIVFGISAVAVIVLEGLPGLFEIPGITANVLSYARIGAAGVVGVIIAEIINTSLLPTPERSIIMFPIFILLHILNAALAMFESIVQGGRLNLVEFYSKFFQGGGKAFEPFRMDAADDSAAHPQQAEDGRGKTVR